MLVCTKVCVQLKVIDCVVKALKRGFRSLPKLSGCLKENPRPLEFNFLRRLSLPPLAL